MSKAKGLGVALPIIMLAAPIVDASAEPVQPAAPAARAPANRTTRPARAGTSTPATPVVSPADLAALSGADLVGAARAADALGASANPAAHEALLDALALGLAPAVAARALAAVAMHPAPSDVAAIVRYTRHRAPAVRSAALAALAAYPGADARAAILALLRDPVAPVRAAAAAAAAQGRVKAAIEPLFVLFARGEEGAARALAQLADPGLATRMTDQLGKVAPATLALALGAILTRADFEPDAARVEVVRTIAKIQDPAAITALTAYIEATPAKPARSSRDEAIAVVAARKGAE